jgi:hypothetical protein
MKNRRYGGNSKDFKYNQSKLNLKGKAHQSQDYHGDSKDRYCEDSEK